MTAFIRLLMLLTIPMAGCAAAQQPVEIIHGLEVKGKTLRIQVTSNGCTTDKSMQLFWQDDHLTVKRIKPDLCRRMPHKKWLEFKLSQQIMQFNLTNKFSD